MKLDIYHAGKCLDRRKYLPCTITFSGNQPSSVVLAEDQARPLPYIAECKDVVLSPVPAAPVGNLTPPQNRDRIVVIYD